MEAMALLSARRSMQDQDATTAPDRVASEPGRGVRATWRYTVASIVLYCLFVNAISTLLMLGDGEYGMQLFDVVILALAVASTAALIRYCWFFRSGLGGGLPERRYTLCLLVPSAALWVLGLAQPHTVWIGALPLWFACNALAVVVRRRIRWWVTGAGLVLLVVHGPLGLLLGHSLGGPFWDNGGVVSVAVWVLMTPLLFVASIWWWEIVLRLDDSRRTSGELAVAKERLRFAADLHDIQGHHLQVIALKTELAGRLLDGDPEAARVQIAEAQQLARTALEDTRALVHGYRSVSLAAEAANAGEVLGGAGIDCSVEVDAEGLAPEERTLFGLVIREATTNILRHSDATTVSLRLDRRGPEAVLTMTNDGICDSAGASTGGSGIDGLRHRFEAVGGRIEAQVKGGTFVLTAVVPKQAAVTTPDAGPVTEAAPAPGIGAALDTVSRAHGGRA
ncbi:histidine kinase [Vibrio cholerae]|nr:histidine kinase [Vibrio cholerae]